MTWLRRIRLVMMWLAVVGLAVGILIWPWYDVIGAVSYPSAPDIEWSTTIRSISYREMWGIVDAVSPILLTVGFAGLASMLPPQKWVGFAGLLNFSMILWLWTDRVADVLGYQFGDTDGVVDIASGYVLAAWSVIILLIVAVLTIIEAFVPKQAQTFESWIDSAPDPYDPWPFDDHELTTVDPDVPEEPEDDPPSEPLEPKTGDATFSEPLDQQVSSEDSAVESKLRELKRLHGLGLVDDTEYTKQQRRLLDGL
jgi:hypothetical protein